MSRPNKCIKDENGNDVWIARSSVVIPIVFKIDIETGDVYTLVEQRGPAVTHPGEWCCPCGYLDWDETLEEACQREVKEETGIDISPDKFIFHKVAADKTGTKQTVDHIYMTWIDESETGNIDLSRVETKDRSWT